MPRLLIYTPTCSQRNDPQCGPGLRPRTADSIKGQYFAGEVDWVVHELPDPLPGRNMRNVGRQYAHGRQLALDGGYDAVLFAEHDMILPAHCVQTLYNTPAPVVYAAYLLRHGQPVVSLWRKNGTKNLGMSYSLFPVEWRVLRARGWGEVSGVGFGCTLIRREILKRIPIAVHDEFAPDIPFATACLRQNILQIGRTDVACGHYTDDGSILEITMDGGVIARVLALQDVTLNIRGEAVPMKKDRYYSIPLMDGLEFQRAGYVRVTDDADEMDREDTADPMERETATARVTKRRPVKAFPEAQPKPKRRTRKAKSASVGNTHENS